ncbi:MAG: T9SS type A sorting domain-containing protein, partial [Flavobacteriales bacterium]
GIYTNAAYVRMVSKFAQGSCFTVSTEELVKTEPYVLIYPLPASEIINIRFPGAESNQLTLEVFDVNGKLLISQKKAILKLVGVAVLDISALTSGVYFLKISDGTCVVSKKVVKE